MPTFLTSTFRRCTVARRHAPLPPEQLNIVLTRAMLGVHFSRSTDDFVVFVGRRGASSFVARCLCEAPP
jgi:hypothetical protein